jgi:hypothetical protein
MTGLNRELRIMLSFYVSCHADVLLVLVSSLLSHPAVEVNLMVSKLEQVR